jgi:uncharacterized protein (TIGR01244 family)
MTEETSLTARGQVHPNEIADLAAQGCRLLINNRPDGEAPDQPSSDELEAEAQRHGMAYCHIPVVPGQATSADARAFKEAMDKADGPVVAFCRTGGRATMLHNMAQQID